MEGSWLQEARPQFKLSILLNVYTPPRHMIADPVQYNSIERFRKIGFGQCGLVFERPGCSNVVKLSRPGYGDALWSDLVAHVKVTEAFKQHDIECKVPSVRGYVSRDNKEWWEVIRPFFERTEQLPMPCNALMTERILPVSKMAREALIDLYCPESLQDSAKSNPTNQDCLVRTYLGRRRADPAKLSPNFTLRNFNLHLDQMIDLYLPVFNMAHAMGEALAVIHWEANVDGYDIEFVLGSDSLMNHQSSYRKVASVDITDVPAHTDLPFEVKSCINHSRYMTRLWCLDFNLCSCWREELGWENPDALIEQLARAFFENDPYYPSPILETELDENLWLSFEKAYMYRSDSILAEKDARLFDLPRKFIYALYPKMT